MPSFDRVAAKAAGYSDAEIEQIIAAGPPQAQANPAEARITDPRARVGRVGINLLPAAGGIAGGILGAAGGIPGVMAGSGLGTAGGEAGRQLLSRWAGFDDGIPDTPQGAAAQIGVAGGMGALLPGATGLGGKLVSGVARAPIVRHLPGASIARRIAGDVSGMVGKFGAKIRGESPPPAAAPAPGGLAADPTVTVARGGPVQFGAPTSTAAVNPAEARIAQAAKPRPKPKLVPKPKPKPKGGNPAEARIAANKAHKPKKASFPELARREKLLSPKAKEVIEDGGLEEKLSESLKLVELMKDKGLTPSEVATVFRAGSRR